MTSFPRLYLRTFAALLTAALHFVSVAQAATAPGPMPYLNYQGFLSDAEGVPVSGTVSMVFRLYTEASGGTAVASFSQEVTVNNGMYSVYLGGVKEVDVGQVVQTGPMLPTDWNHPYWLGISVGSDAEMTPRQLLAAAPYAHTAGDQNGFLVKSMLGVGSIPVTGPGERFMWYGSKGAFRAGSVNGDQWDADNVGYLSFAAGAGTKASGLISVALGNATEASGTYATAFGRRTVSSGWASTALGDESTASGYYAIAGGYKAHAPADGAIALGNESTASGGHAIALGTGARAIHSGSIVIADGAQWGGLPHVIQSSAENQFTVRAVGGTRIYSGLSPTGVTLSSGSGAWETVSDRNAKTDFEPVDPESVLAKVAALPISTWRYREEVGEPRHMGPMAQDFRSAFGLGRDEVTISTVDIDGVNMAAIQGLERRTNRLQAAIEARDETLAALREELAVLRAENGSVAALREEVATLRAQNATLTSERMALDRRLDRLEALLLRADITPASAPVERRRRD